MIRHVLRHVSQIGRELHHEGAVEAVLAAEDSALLGTGLQGQQDIGCLLYTSDAADEL